MNKKFKLLFILVLVALGALALWPSYKWYFSLTQQERDIANASRENIREQSQKMATEEVDKLLELVRENPKSEVPEEYSFLVEAAKEKYKIAKLKAPEKWTLDVVMNTFKSTTDSVQSLVNLRAAFENYYS